MDKRTSYMPSMQNRGRNTAECVELHKDETTKVTKDDIFKEDVYHLKKIANKLQKTIDKLTQTKA